MRIGSAWTARGRPPAGFFTRRTAEAWLRGVLNQPRAGTLRGLVRTGVSFAEAAEKYLTWLEVDRERKPSTLRDYRSILKKHLLPTSGAVLIEDVSPAQIEGWRLELNPALANRTKIRSSRCSTGSSNVPGRRTACG
jgi:integrase